MLKIRRPLGRFIFNMGIAIPGKTVFLIETPPRWPLSTICQKMEKSPQDISPSWHQIYRSHIQVMSLLPWMPQISHVLAAQRMLVGDIWHPLSACLPGVTLIPLRQTQNDCHFAGDIFESIFLNEKIGNLMDISFFFAMGLTDNTSALVQIMAWCGTGNIAETICRKVSKIRGTKSQNLSDRRLDLQLPLANPLKPGVKLRTKM